MHVRPPDDAARKEIEATLDASLALLPRELNPTRTTGYWVDKWHDTVISIIKDYRDLGIAPEAAYERADAKMANIPELEEIRLMVRGSFWFNYGWEARTQAFGRPLCRPTASVCSRTANGCKESIRGGVEAPSLERLCGRPPNGHRQIDRGRPCHDGVVV